MSPVEDGAELRKLFDRWVTRCFYVRSREITESFGGNYAEAGALDIRSKVREVTFSSDVSDWVKVCTKLGRTVAAESGSFGAKHRSAS